VPRRSAAETGWLLADATIALIAGGARRGSRIGVAAARVVWLLADLTMRPPLVPQRYWPDRRLAELADSGRDQRRCATAMVQQLFGQLVVDAVVTRVDLDAIVARLDLAELARYVVAAIDLPAIIRESTGSMISDAVQENRIQSREADQAVAAWVERVFRSGPGGQGEAGEPDQSTG